MFTVEFVMGLVVVIKELFVADSKVAQFVPELAIIVLNKVVI